MMEILDNGMVRDVFEMSRNGLTFRGALVMPMAEYEALSSEQISAMKQARFDAWYSFIEPPAETQE